MEAYYGQHAFEDLMTRELVEPEKEQTIFLVDVAAELHVSEEELGYFSWRHLSDDDYNAYAGTLTANGRELLLSFLGPGRVTE